MKQCYFDELPIKQYLELTDRVCDSVERYLEKSGGGTFPTFKQIQSNFNLTFNQVEYIVIDHENLFIENSNSDKRSEWTINYKEDEMRIEPISRIYPNMDSLRKHDEVQEKEIERVRENLDDSSDTRYDTKIDKPSLGIIR